MLAIRHLVVPLDGSAQANAALPIAVALAAPLGMGVLLVRATLALDPAVDLPLLVV